VFHFKKFSIDDSSAAMKIGTDAVILGAWVECENESRILDIGTGSGILALMMAQRNSLIPIDAVEIENQAARLAEQNALLSPWHGQIKVHNTSIQEFASYNQHRYSLILCNPPFFSDSLKSPGETRNLARHNDSLPVIDLLKITSELITRKGKAAFIIPFDAYESWKQEAEKFKLFPSRFTLLKSTPKHKPHRVLATLANTQSSAITENELVIYDSGRSYSKEYHLLTREFYLHF